MVLFDVQTFGSEQLDLIQRAALKLEIVPDALADITFEDCDMILERLSLTEALKVFETWGGPALACAEDILRNPPEGCVYKGYGLSCVVLEGEILFGPYVSYDWDDEEQRYGEHDIVLLRTSESEFGIWGSSLEKLLGWPDSARTLDEDDAD